MDFVFKMKYMHIYKISVSITLSNAQRVNNIEISFSTKKYIVYLK